MEFLGIGPLELVFILIIALIILGPRDMVKTGRTIGRFLRSIVQSPAWNTVQQTSRELRYLPNKLIREAGLEEDAKALQQISKELDMRPDTQSLAKSLLSTQREAQEVQSGLAAWTTPVETGAGSTGAAPGPVQEASEPAPSGPEAPSDGNSAPAS
jgi:Sec-independent protein translocase protein TatA